MFKFKILPTAQGVLHIVMCIAIMSMYIMSELCGGWNIINWAEQILAALASIPIS